MVMSRTMKFSLKQIEAFVWAADLQSFRQTAERLNTTQPNISSRIANLEAQLETKLMERDAGSVRLTAKGKELLKEARQVLRSIEGFMAVAGQSGGVDGVVKLGVTEMIVNTWLRVFLKACRQQYPGLRIELTVDMSVNLKSELFSRSIDIAFQNGPFQRKTSGSEDLGCYPYIWVASPELAITGIAKPTTEQIRQEPLLIHGRETVHFADIQAHFGGVKGRIPDLSTSNNMTSCLHMALDGLGIAVLPAAMVQTYIEAGQLVALDYPWVPKPLIFEARYDAETTPAYIAEVAKLAQGISLGYMA